MDLFEFYTTVNEIVDYRWNQRIKNPDLMAQ